MGRVHGDEGAAWAERVGGWRDALETVHVESYGDAGGGGGVLGTVFGGDAVNAGVSDDAIPGSLG